MFIVLRSFKDEESGRGYSRGIVASADELGGAKAVKKLMANDLIKPYEVNDGPQYPAEPTVQELKGRIAELEAENAAQKARLEELEDGPPPHPYQAINGIGLEIAVALENAGFNSLDEIAAAEDDRLLAISGIGKGLLAKIREHFENAGGG